MDWFWRFLCPLSLITCFGCSTTPTGGACTAASSKIDLAAQLDLRDMSGAAAAALYSEDVSSFGAGTTKNYVFVIKNIANATTAKALTIKSVAVTEVGPDDKPVATPAYGCIGPGNVPCSSATWPQVIPSGFDSKCAAASAVNSVPLTIRMIMPPDGQLRHAKVAITFEGDPAWKSAAKVLTFAMTAGVPKLDCAPVVDFGHMVTGDTKVQTFKCLNSGSASAEVTGVDLLTKAMPLELIFAGTNVTPAKAFEGTPQVMIPAGVSLEITATLGPLASDDMQSATMELKSNDQSHPVISVKFVVNSGACMTIDPPSVDFGVAAVGAPATRAVKLVSCGTGPVTITQIVTSSPGFSVDCSTGSCFSGGQCPSDAAPLTMQPLSTPCTFLATYTPSKVGEEASGQIDIASDAGADKHLMLQGKGSMAAAPTPCLTAKLGAVAVASGGVVVPQSVLTLDASCSKATTGHVVSKWKWTIVQKAQGNYTTFQPSPQAKTVTYQPNVAGNYVISLDIADEVGTAGAKTLLFEFSVVPDDMLHVELTWETLADADPTDKNGTDLDLHLAHPNAVSSGQKDHDGNGEPDPWFAKCFDCYVLNKTPEWGDFQDLDDNAHLDLDAQDSHGPENTNIHTPEPDFLYYVGVFNWSGGQWTLSPTTPRVRIYLNKVLAADKSGPAMVADDMWCAARVSWSEKVQQVLPCKGADAKGNLLTPKYPVAMPNNGYGCP